MLVYTNTLLRAAATLQTPAAPTPRPRHGHAQGRPSILTDLTHGQLQRKLPTPPIGIPPRLAFVCMLSGFLQIFAAAAAALVQPTPALLGDAGRAWPNLLKRGLRAQKA